MKNSWKVIIGIAVVLLIIGIPFVSTYNSLNKKENAVDAQWANVESKLQRRYDLIPNLVNAVKGDMKQEKEVFGQIADARAAVSKASSQSEQIKAAGQMDQAVTRLIATVENYPDLKSSANVTRLMDELSGTENRISVERDKYNTEVQAYNTKVKSAPTSFVAGMLGFDTKPYFKAVEGADKAPEVNFD
ncbi:lemA protein [Listeria floridensis FSL S10-1187]|uniref:LemA protein n=1 Tax=Listeria floridensis FSL S10-1187 TaxID=1265817 RepID=A0ABN0RFJ1_9LIST|nr:LemA family protein [Listeria floridensis]EUJ32047.1 lemA protein [Listeria floridensis FSL S10-1187]